MRKDIAKLLINLIIISKKFIKKLGITLVLHGQEAPYAFCERIGFDWYVDVIDSIKLFD